MQMYLEPGKTFIFKIVEFDIPTYDFLLFLHFKVIFITSYCLNKLLDIEKFSFYIAYAVVLRLNMLQIYLYQYWTVAETQKEMEIGSLPIYTLQCTCVDLFIIIIKDQ